VTASPGPDELAEVDALIARGNLQKAELLVRRVLVRTPENPAALTRLGRIASEVGSFEIAAQHFTQALRQQPSEELEQELQTALRDEQARRERRAAMPARPRYLLIKAWGYGFWSDVDHVAGQLLLAELTGRTPVVHWGSNSLFGGEGVENAFESFFQPVSSVAARALQVEGWSYFPAKWNSRNLLDVDLNKLRGPGSRMSALYSLNRDEDVVVSDFHSKVNDLLPWIPAHSPYFGLDRNAVYRAIYARHLKLQPHLAGEVSRLWEAHFAGKPWLAVHVRGSDKATEVANLAALNQAYHGIIAEILQANPTMRIFLLTDSTQALRDFEGRYQGRVLYVDCQRSDSMVGVHNGGHEGTLIGQQVIIDAYLAARCDAFLGNGTSNVSVCIRHLKDWEPGHFLLLGDDVLARPTDPALHDW
jgi:protein O-GlcNAc transferase